MSAAGRGLDRAGDGPVSPRRGGAPLIDPHAHFHTPQSNRLDWARYNASRLEAGDRIGVRWHVASVLGSWGHTSPTYFASPDDQARANRWLFELARREPRVRAWVAVNPNFTAHALDEIAAGAAAGAVGIKLAAGRRADHALLDAIAAAAAEHDWPILQHVWQHRRREWPMQDASDAVELARLAARHPRTRFLLAHIGGGGDWAHTLPAVRELPNLWLDLSGSGIDRGMLDAAVLAVGAQRLLWAADLTLCTGLTKLRALEAIGLAPGELADIRWRNAVRLFPAGTFPGLDAAVAGDEEASDGA